MGARTGGVARHTALNLVGQGAPLVAAFFAIPVITRALGPERFGVLTIGWAVLGYVSLFDFGLGRALTSLVAVAAHDGDDDRVARLVWTGLRAMLPLGLAAAALTALLAGPLVHRVLNVSPAIQGETLRALRLLAPAIPAVILTAGLRGVLEGIRRFDLANALKVPLGLATFLAPVAVLPFSRTLPAIFAALVVARLLALAAHAVAVRRALPVLRAPRRGARGELRELLRFGSWMTVSNLLSPLMVTGDRFVIGALLSMTAVAYYTAPYEAVTRLLVIPAAVSTALFPAFAASYQAARDGAGALYARWLRLTALALLPFTLVAVLFAGEILRLWLGPDYAAQSAVVLQILAVGVLVNGLGFVSFAFVQAAGRPDLTARLHLLELPLYGLALWWLAPRFGIAGAAAAWALRAAVDAVLLGRAASAMHRTRLPRARRRLAATLALATPMLAALLPLSLAARVAVLGAAALLLPPLAWRLALDDAERAMLLGFVSPRRAAVARETPPAA